MTYTVPSEIEVHTYLAAADERALADDVLDGLTRPFKELPPKHFYDARGAELFDRICDLPEYYPTRTERAILQARAEEIVDLTGAAEIVELGSGTAAKTRILLDELETYEHHRTKKPVTVSVLIERDSGFVLDIRAGALPARRARGAPRPPKDEKRRKSESRQNVKAAFERLRETAPKGKVLCVLTDVKTSYAKLLRQIFGERCQHIRIPSTRRRDRNPAADSECDFH
jgi:hypothetical protein